MDNFILILSFSLVPFATAAVLSLVLPLLGASLCLRNESILAVSISAVGTAILAVLIALGISPGSPGLLFILSAAGLFVMLSLLFTLMDYYLLSPRYRSTALVALFVLSNMTVIWIQSRSHHVSALFDTLLEGELLAVPPRGLWLAAGAVILFFVLLIPRRYDFYAHSVDPLILKNRKNHLLLTTLHRALLSCFGMAGILLLGPLLTSALFILPAFFLEPRSAGCDRYMIRLMAAAFTGTAAGLLLSIGIDMPPAPVAAAGIACVSLGMSLLPGAGDGS
ncbi:MAG: metal ABC transporter permease [Fibrobacterota bacterium]